MLSFCFIVFASSFVNDNLLRLWYTKPSSKTPLKMPQFQNDNNENYFSNDNAVWQQNTLPIGNGFIGANIFGEIEKEKLTFNEISLWEGGPSTKRPNYNGGNLEDVGKHGELFNEVRRLFKEKKTEEAQKLALTLLGDSDLKAFGSYQGFGELGFEFKDISATKVTNFVRYLDLDISDSFVNFEQEGNTYWREYFASFPDKVIVIKFNSTTAPMSEIKVNFSPYHPGTTVVKNHEITIRGQLDDNQMKFNGKIKAVISNGKGQIIEGTDHLLIKDADEVIFYVSGATDYKNVYPKYRTGESDDEVDARLETVIDSAVKKGYDAIRIGHLKDYQKIFSRVDINLNQLPSQLPTDELLKGFNSDQVSEPVGRGLVNLLFQYGRYLQISSSREGSLPPNLQGLWNDLTENVPWTSDYHLNINLQMNYFPTFITNMFECGPPLIDFVESLIIPGRITADIYTGIKTPTNKLNQNKGNGYMFHTKANLFGFTAPGHVFSWGWSPACSLWILANCFDYFTYTCDYPLLKTRLYPMMREVAFYFESLFTRDEERNRTITSPTFSPEHGPPTNGNTYEQTLVWQHFKNLILAADTVKEDQEHIPRWKNLLEELKPIEIGESGQIKEWYEETYLGSMGDKNHRHMSHLLGLFPLELIQEDETPEWMEAAKVSMNDRGDKTTGWGMGQRINAWARTGDGDRAYSLIKSLFKNGIYNNLWDTHPPFQIDGNFAATSGIAEMLLRSSVDCIYILPAIPSQWKKNPTSANEEIGGSFDGLVAKGGVVVGATWDNGFNKFLEIRFDPNWSRYITVKAKGITKVKIVDNTGRNVPYSVVGNDKITLLVYEDMHYSVTDFQ